MHPVWYFLNGNPYFGPVFITGTVTATGTITANDYVSTANGGGLFIASNAVQFRRNSSNADAEIVSNSALAMRFGASSVTTTLGLGYGTGAGGAQTQGTSKATTVVSNTVTGEITMHNASLNAATAVTFALTNSTIATGDMVLVQHVSAGTLGAYVCQAVAGSGTANITVTNRSAGALGEAIVLKYIVFKAVTA